MADLIPTNASIKQDISWLKQHEYIVIALLVVVLGFYGFAKYSDIAARNADAQVAIAKQAQVAKDEQVAQMQAAMAQQKAEFDARDAQTKQEMAMLTAAIAQRDVQASRRIEDVTAPGKTPSQAVTDLTTAYPKLPAPVTTTATGAEVPTADIQTFTATKIEDDTAKADLHDIQKQLQATSDSLDSAVKLLGTQDNVITGLRADIKTHDATCEDEKKQIKADARKTGFHRFLEGAATAAAIILRFAKF